jgi:hypothetical protein
MVYLRILFRQINDVPFFYRFFSCKKKTILSPLRNVSICLSGGEASGGGLPLRGPEARPERAQLEEVKASGRPATIQS